MSPSTQKKWRDMSSCPVPKRRPWFNEHIMELSTWLPSDLLTRYVHICKCCWTMAIGLQFKAFSVRLTRPPVFNQKEGRCMWNKSDSLSTRDSVKEKQTKTNPHFHKINFLIPVDCWHYFKGRRWWNNSLLTSVVQSFWVTDFSFVFSFYIFVFFRVQVFATCVIKGFLISAVEARRDIER